MLAKDEGNLEWVRERWRGESSLRTSCSNDCHLVVFKVWPLTSNCSITETH